ncbi:MAG: DUF3047 domain-containing protein [Rhodospirillaceae bacterium]|jgi:hypothetical protein|nr:DUF3047 domain-containing protein [Rhodospirillaceae bacterium]MBT5563052.1 DUF3047 domain-containing protein [Rhodospirillaceae bacterium]MBT7138491.1 DUF3047 domain-containing protein [Rhodospirillaceae bacterium]
MSGPLKTVVLSLLLLSWASGCAIVPQASVAPEGLLQVLGPFPGFSPVELPGDWAIEKDGELDENQLQIMDMQGVPSLKVTNGSDSFVVVRRTQAMMLATPFLSWSWNIEPPSTTGYHPVRLVVGFYGGDPESPSRGSEPLRWLGSDLPAHDRALSLTWGESALQRGTLSPPPESDNRAAPRYSVRGGRENAGSWWLETVDLYDLYHRSWPKDDAGKTQVVFIGVAAAGNRPPAPAYISGIVLSR